MSDMVKVLVDGMIVCKLQMEGLNEAQRKAVRRDDWGELYVNMSDLIGGAKVAV